MSAERLNRGFRADVAPGGRRPINQRGSLRAGILHRSSGSRRDIISRLGKTFAESPSRHDPLEQLALANGIQLSYVDMAQKVQRASASTLRAVLETLSVAAHNTRAVRDSLREREEQRWREVLPPVAVVWDGQPSAVICRLPRAYYETPRFAKLHFEDGSCKSINWEPSSLRLLEAAEINGRTYLAAELRLPQMPFGYHHLEFEVKRRVHHTFIISSPKQSYAPRDSSRMWGLFSPTYSLHSRSSWGAGSLGDLRALIDFAAEKGAGFVGTLPLLSTFLDCPFCEPSPYSPASRLFWNEFYIHVESVPEFSASATAQRVFHSPPLQQVLSGVRQDPLIDYREQFKLRRQVLEPMARHFFTHDSPRRKAFEVFLEHNRRLSDYATFRATCEKAKASWPRWEERLQNGKLQAGDFDPGNRDYHIYCQWVAQEQMNALRDHCHRRQLRLYLDLPVGVHSESYDLWRERDSFVPSVSVGAPPDPVFTSGQIWGFPPLHPQRIRERNYGYVLEYLRFQMRHAGMLRIDHILGLHRLFWIPQGFPPSAGAYVSYPTEELQALLCLESHRNGTIVAGENLGTVPPEVNEAMRRHAFRETFVLQYEQKDRQDLPIRTPPECSVASLNTHDMPPFKAHCQGLDIEDRADLGLVSSAKRLPEHNRRQKLCKALRIYLQRQNLLRALDANDEELSVSCLKWLARSPAESILVNIEDLWGETESQNVPGTCVERPNWRRKLRFNLESIVQSAEFAQILEQLNAFRRRRVKRRSPEKLKDGSQSAQRSR